MKKEELLVIGKAAAPPAVALFQKVTELLPTFVIWVSAVYAVLHLYVLIRDKLIRKPDAPAGGGNG